MLLLKILSAENCGQVKQFLDLQDSNLDELNLCGVTHLLWDFRKHLLLILSQEEHLPLSMRTSILI